jgi:hypothetical protein
MSTQLLKNQNCSLCGKEFTLSRGRINSVRKTPEYKIYCSPECRSKGRSASKTKHQPVSRSCQVCGKEFVLNNSQAWKLRNGKKDSFCCSRSCSSKEIFSRPEFQEALNSEDTKKKREKSLAALLLPKVNMACAECQQEFELSMSQRSEFTSGRQSRFFCSKGCRTRWVLKQPGQQEIRQKKLALMRSEHDFMNTPEAIAKRVVTLKKTGVTGGSGRPPSESHKMLADALSLPIEYPVKSGLKRSLGFKAVYHIDIANPDVKLAIEVDGKSHRYGLWPERDRKKTQVLNDLGWTVLRFTNEEIKDDLESCVQKVLDATSKIEISISQQ